MIQFREALLQDVREHDSFIKILRDEGVRSYLEIGSMWGGSLWRVANALPRGSRIVSIDWMCDRPEARDSLTACVKELCAIGYDAHFIFGDSADRKTIDAVAALGPFDALFIDGNHSQQYVTMDWLNYGPMARIVGFHDINWNDSWTGARGKKADPAKMGVPKFWNDIKQRHSRHVEFKFHPAQNYYGIGVLWR